MGDAAAAAAAPGADHAEEQAIAIPVESPPPADAAIAPGSEAEQPASKFVSQGQGLLDRYKRQFDRMFAIHRRLVALKGVVVAVPAGKPVAELERPNRDVPFFGGLIMIADSSDAAIKAIEDDLAAIEKLF